MKKPPVIAMRPFRLWMTGSLAVVMAAMIPLREMSSNDRSGGLRVLRHSRYGVVETVQRLETAARGGGLSVLAMMRGAQPVLVLASSIGGTPIVMRHFDSMPTMPLSVVVREVSGGGADVCIAVADGDELDDEWNELPPAVADDLHALPALVERALA